VKAVDVARGVWAWAARHPEWTPGLGWDADVWCYLVRTEDVVLVVDPLLPPGDEREIWRRLDAAPRLAVVLTQAAHARDAGDVARRYGVAVWGHEHAREKLGGAGFHPVAAGDEIPGGARVLGFDQEPGGSGTPLYLPSHRAVAVGDVFINVDGELRAWWGTTHAGGRRWYDDRALPALRRWLELPIERVLVAHGEQVSGGGDALAAALERAPYEQE
jgi:Metallo-beta-lactamase superfamily